MRKVYVRIWTRKIDLLKFRFVSLNDQRRVRTRGWLLYTLSIALIINSNLRSGISALRQNLTKPFKNISLPTSIKTRQLFIFFPFSHE